MAVDGNVVFVVDEDASRIFRFTDNSSDNIVQDWAVGAPGVDPGEFNDPWGIAVDGSRVYVGDYSNERMQALSAADGSFLFQWIGLEDGNTRVDPQSIAVGANGKVYVAGIFEITTFEIRS